MIENLEAWEGTPEEEAIRKDMLDDKGKEFEYGDRRQELVFIGMDLKHTKIQSLLDHCLLSDEEMELKPNGWFDKWDDINKIKWVLLINIFLPNLFLNFFSFFGILETIDDPEEPSSDNDFEYQPNRYGIMSKVKT